MNLQLLAHLFGATPRQPCIDAEWAIQSKLAHQRWEVGLTLEKINAALKTIAINGIVLTNMHMLIGLAESKNLIFQLKENDNYVRIGNGEPTLEQTLDGERINNIMFHVTSFLQEEPIKDTNTLLCSNYLYGDETFINKDLDIKIQYHNLFEIQSIKYI